MSTTQAPKRVLIVGTGLTGSLSCYHLRNLARKQGLSNLRIEVADMARGAGGRMSTTWFGTDSLRANTGAQYLSAASTEATTLLQKVCDEEKCPLDEVPNPLSRSTHFILHPASRYKNYLPRKGTNAVLKQLLERGEPDLLVFESRLKHMVEDAKAATPQLIPLFDKGGTKTSTAYDAAILALPPKDILKLFNTNHSMLDDQSQAVLHRRTNQGRAVSIQGNLHRPIELAPSVVIRLEDQMYNGRYSLNLWFQDTRFAKGVAAEWGAQHKSHPVLDMVSAQEQGRVLVAQSTTELWRQFARLPNGGRREGKAAIVEALEELVGSRMPRYEHTKLLNWRCSQVLPPAGGGVVTTANGRLIFAGDWCFESSFEGCNLAAESAAAALMKTII